MLGPLPKAYQVAVTVWTLGVFIAFGAWAALAVPILAFTGATIGAALGAIVVVLLLHEPEPHGAPARTRRHPRDG